MSKYMEKTSRPTIVWAEDWNLRWPREVPIYKDWYFWNNVYFETPFLLIIRIA
jgi:hypothetical protein